MPFCKFLNSPFSFFLSTYQENPTIISKLFFTILVVFTFVMALLRIFCWTLTFILRIRFPPGLSTGSILMQVDHEDSTGLMQICIKLHHTCWLYQVASIYIIFMFLLKLRICRIFMSIKHGDFPQFHLII